MYKYEGRFELFTEQGMEGNYIPLLVVPGATKINSINALFSHSVCDKSLLKIESITIKKGLEVLYSGSFKKLLNPKRNIFNGNMGNFEFDESKINCTFAALLIGAYQFELTSKVPLLSYKDNYTNQVNQLAVKNETK